VAVLQQRVDDGIRLLKQAVAAHPQVLQPRMELARLLLRNAERPRESTRQPDAEPDSEPDSERDAERGAQAAVAVLKDKAPQAFRRDGDYLYLLADALRASGALQSAAGQLRELIAMRPNSREAYALYARVLTELDDKVALEAALTQMLSIDPRDQLARLELVRLHIATERFSTAERLLQPVLADPARPPLADLLEGLILTATDRAIQALPSLRRAYARSPSPRSLMALANAEADAALLDTAIKRQQLWLEQHPNDLEVRVNLGGHLVRAGAVDEAIAQYRRVLEVQPDHLVALNNLAWYGMNNDLSESLAFATRALEIAPESLAVAHTLATAQIKADQWRDAELTLDRALSRYPTDNELLWLSAQVLHHKGRRERAMEHLSRILERDPTEDERERAKALLIRIEDEQRAEAAAKLY
jgi:tetratricopeptide (TPR) repeat protein